MNVVGKAHFSRSGKATVTAGHLSVTVTVRGGLAGTPLCFANLRSYRSGVAVAAVRPNYPTAGKMRIYLTKTMSRSTSVSWIVRCNATAFSNTEGNSTAAALSPSMSINFCRAAV